MTVTSINDTSLSWNVSTGNTTQAAPTLRSFLNDLLKRLGGQSSSAAAVGGGINTMT